MFPGFQGRRGLTLGAGLLLFGLALFALRSMDLWRNPYQLGRVWQTFDIARELERVHGVPWDTELSPMSGGTRPAPFLQEFPFAQYAVWLVNDLTPLSIPQAGQLIAILIALLSAGIWGLYASRLPVPPGVRLALAAVVFFVPAFLRYEPAATPDALVFLMNLGGACLIANGVRDGKPHLSTHGAVLIGLAVLAKTTTLLAAGMVGLALLLEGQRRASVALALATIPGLAWAALCHSVNQSAAAVNDFARIGLLHEYWWNPRLYLDPWWARAVVFALYDVLGCVGLLACAWIWFRLRKPSDSLLPSIFMVLPAAITILLFNYHSASHHYYSLIWLPFTLVGAVELSLDRLSHLDRLPSYTLILATGVALATLNVTERHLGIAEKFIARQPDAAQPFFRLHADSSPPAPCELRSRDALQLVKQQGASFVGYLGSSWEPFLDLGLRGWVVEPGESDPHARLRVSHMPQSVIHADERFQLNANWFHERAARGMDAVLIQRGGEFDTAEILYWARSAGLAVAKNQPCGYALLLRSR